MPTLFPGITRTCVLVALVSGCAANPSTRPVGESNRTAATRLAPIPPSQRGDQTASVSVPAEETPVKLVEFQDSKGAETTLIGPPSEILPAPTEVIRWNTEKSADIGADNYDLPTLLSLASSNNPTLQQANLHISASLAQAQQAGLYPNPLLAYVGENIGNEGTAGEFQGAAFQQRFVTANKLELSRNKYLQRAKVAEHLAVMQQFKVCNDVRLHYINTLAAQSLLELHREMLKTAEDRLVTAKESFNLGQANKVEIHQATAELRRHQLDVFAAENRVRKAFFDLSAVVGIELAQRPIVGGLTSNCDLIDFDGACGRLLRESPELLAAYAKLQADHLTVYREQVQWVPDIVVSGGPGYNFTSQDTVASLRVQIEVPLFDRNQGTIRQAEADQGRQRFEVRRIEMTLRRRLSAEYDRYITALQKVVNYDGVVLPEMKQAYEQVLESYRDNRQDWPRVLDVHTQYTMRRIEQIENLHQLCSSEILIEGFLLKDGLDAALNPTPPGHIDSTPKPR